MAMEREFGPTRGKGANAVPPEWIRDAVRLYRLFKVAVIVGLLAWGVYTVLPLIYPFLIAFLLAIAFNPLVNRLEKQARLPRWLAVILTMTLLLSLMLSILGIVISEIIGEIGTLANQIPRYIAEFRYRLTQLLTVELTQSLYERFSHFYEALDPESQARIHQHVQDVVERLADSGGKLAVGFLQALQSLLLSLPNAATVMVIVLLATFFISKDFRRIRRTLVEWIPVPLHDSTRAVVADLRRALVGFVKAQLTLTSVTALLVLVGLLLLRVPYAVTIALLTGLVDLLPYLGTGAVFVPWIAYLFITGQIALAIGLSALYVIIIIVRQILEPKVLATNVGLDPLVTLIALFVGLKLWGFVGLIAGPAAVVILGALKRAGVFRDLWTYITRV